MFREERPLWTEYRKVSRASTTGLISLRFLQAYVRLYGRKKIPVQSNDDKSNRREKMMIEEIMIAIAIGFVGAVVGTIIGMWIFHSGKW